MAVRDQVMDQMGLTGNLEALLIVEDVDDTLVARDWDRRRKDLGPVVAQLDAMGQPVLFENLTRPIRSTERVHCVDAVVSVPAWEGSHQ